MAALEPRRPRRPHPSFERGVAAEEKSNNLNLPVAECRPRYAAWTSSPRGCSPNAAECRPRYAAWTSSPRGCSPNAAECRPRYAAWTSSSSGLPSRLFRPLCAASINDLRSSSVAFAYLP